MRTVSPPARPAIDRARITALEPASPLRPGYVPLKTALEWIAALVLFILVAPLIGFLYLLVRLTSDGPGFYLQTRMGQGGRVYRMVKIRTMTHNAEANTGAVWSSGANDRRVTRVGRFLRDTHLDELPQLWNILCGDMALIGPRPERPEIVRQIERDLPRYHDRMLIRPGLTGFAQIQHGADQDLDTVRRKLMYDLYYVRQISFLLDFRVALGTASYFAGVTFTAMCKLMVRGHGAEAERFAEAEAEAMAHDMAGADLAVEMSA